MEIGAKNLMQDIGKTIGGVDSWAFKDEIHEEIWLKPTIILTISPGLNQGVIIRENVE